MLVFFPIVQINNSKISQIEIHTMSYDIFLKKFMLIVLIYLINIYNIIINQLSYFQIYLKLYFIIFSIII
jgi:hypothetical protein